MYVYYNIILVKPDEECYPAAVDCHALPIQRTRRVFVNGFIYYCDDGDHNIGSIRPLHYSC